MEQGNFTAAEREFRAIIEIEDAHWVVNYLNLSGALLRQGKLSAALEMLQKAIDCDTGSGPSDFNANEKIAKANAYWQMADLLLVEDQGKNMQKATEFQKKGLELDPNDGYRWRKLSTMLANQGDLAGARNAMERANQAGHTSGLAAGIQSSEFVRL